VKSFSNAKDVTEYARDLGYLGAKPVLVMNGRVVSHGKVCWNQFCDRLRKG